MTLFHLLSQKIFLLRIELLPDFHCSYWEFSCQSNCHSLKHNLTFWVYFNIFLFDLSVLLKSHYFTIVWLGVHLFILRFTGILYWQSGVLYWFGENLNHYLFKHWCFLILSFPRIKTYIGPSNSNLHVSYSVFLIFLISASVSCIYYNFPLHSHSLILSSILSIWLLNPSFESELLLFYFFNFWSFTWIF